MDKRVKSFNYLVVQRNQAGWVGVTVSLRPPRLSDAGLAEPDRRDPAQLGAPQLELRGNCGWTWKAVCLSDSIQELSAVDARPDWTKNTDPVFQGRGGSCFFGRPSFFQVRFLDKEGFFIVFCMFI